MKITELSKEQKRVLTKMLNLKNETAYECQSTMRTMLSLLNRDLVERINYGESVWLGSEQNQVKFRLTASGRKLAEEK